MNLHLVMGNQAYSSWSLRGWLLLEPFSIDFSHEVVPLYVPEFERFLEANAPANTVPALIVQDEPGRQILWDSLAIAEFLHERYPTAGIWPEDAAARAAARCLCAEMHSSYLDLRSTMPMNVRRRYTSFVPNEAARRDIDRLELLWNWARAQWGGSGPYLFGEHFCAADAFYAPVASRFDTYRVSLRPESRAYVETLLAHPATRQFCEAGANESWILDACEMDID